jgi:hypothetical protein
MFPFWYGHYPYQVAEYDECPDFGLWDFPQPLTERAPGGRVSKPSIIWRPWFSRSTDLFSFFQVDALTTCSYANDGGGKEERKIRITEGRQTCRH